MLWKCCTQYASKFGKFSSGHRTGKSVFIPIPKKGNVKECSNYWTIALISHASKVMLKILQARLQQYVNRELADVQNGFRKAEGSEIKLPWSIGSSKKQDNSRKTSTSAPLTMLRPDCVGHSKQWKILKEVGIPDHLSYFLWNLYCRSRSNS